MAFVEWDECLRLGIEEIDAQHKNLLEIINDLWTGWRQKQPCDILLILLGQLHRYAAEHFQFEQELMERTRFEGLAEHQLQHDVLLGEVRRLGRHCSSCSELMDLEFFEYLRNWHLDHTQDLDVTMARHLLSFQAAAQPE
jgi:hemerythrin-like metal-binding protein